MSERPTPRTDALWITLAKQGWNRYSLPVPCVMESFERLERELAEAREQIKHHKQAAELNKQEIEKAIPEPPSPQWIAINLLARQRDELADALRQSMEFIPVTLQGPMREALKLLEDHDKDT